MRICRIFRYAALQNCRRSSARGCARSLDATSMSDSLIVMLILSRKVDESIVIDGRIIVKVLRIERDCVKLGVQAPRDILIHREEIQKLEAEKAKRKITDGGEGSPAPLEPQTA